MDWVAQPEAHRRAAALRVPLLGGLNRCATVRTVPPLTGPAGSALGKAPASRVIPERLAQGLAAAVHPWGADAEDHPEIPVPAVVGQDEAHVPAAQAHKAAPQACPGPMAGRRSVRECPTKVRRAAAKPLGPASRRRARLARQGPHRGRAEIAIRIAGSA